MTSTENLQLLAAPVFAMLRRPVEFQFEKECDEPAHGFQAMAHLNRDSLPLPMRQVIAGIHSIPALPPNYFESDNSFDASDPEILLTDSEDEDDFIDFEKVEVETAIDSTDLNNLSQGDFDDLGDFDEEPIGHDAQIQGADSKMSNILKGFADEL